MPNTPDLAEFDEEAARSSPGQRLKIDVILEQLDDQRRQALLAALRNHTKYTAPVIARTVSKWGHKLDDGSVRKWRNRDAAS